MIKMKSPIKALCAAAALGVAAFGAAAPANAQSLTNFLNELRDDSRRQSQENEARLQEFRNAVGEQEQRMAQARGELNAAEARGRDLSAQFDANEIQLGELQAELENLAGDFGELLGQFRQAAGETMPVLANSLANFDADANDPTKFVDESGAPIGRVEKLSQISQARTLPSRADLDALPLAMLLEMGAQSEVTEFDAEIAALGPDGENLTTTLTRIGVFTAAANDGARFVEVIDPGSQNPTFLQAFKTQPGGAVRSQMRGVINANADAVVKGPLDPQKGDLLGIFGELPTLSDRIGQGGPVGMVIIAILIVGAILALFKIVSLALMGMSMGGTKKSKQAGDGNPLARVFEAYEQHKNDDMETLELKLDEQILQETPKIERFNDIIKVLSAVAPLLGLLGTVIGMIITFTSITIYGAGDPKLMAGGISTALMTTVLGLVAAIPLLLLHAVASSMARAQQQVLDEQAAGLVAQRAERGGAAA